MKSSVYVFDPTTSDSQSRVRGVGRYLQLLKENFEKEFIFINNLSSIQDLGSSIFINPFFNFLQPPLVMRRIAQKQIAVIHDLIPLKYPDHFPAGIKGNINIYLNKLALKNYDLIATDSEASKKDILQILRIEESRVRVIYPCLPHQLTNYNSQITNHKSNSNFPLRPSDFEGRVKFQISNSFCLYVGDATWNKNLVNLARAIKIANVNCVFVGKVFNQESSLPSEALAKDGWQKEFKEFIELTRNDKRFIFTGFIEDYELVKLYQQAKVNILVSSDEGFGFSYLEAAKFACPSVLSDIPVLREISNSQGAVFANPNDPNEIADKIGEIYFHPDLRNKLSLEAQQRAKYFNLEKFKKELMSYLK